MDCQRILLSKNIPNCLVYIIRSRNGGIAQTVVVDIFRTDNGGAGAAVFKKIAAAGINGSLI